MTDLDGQEREALKTARRRIRQIHEAGSDSRRREITTDAICEIDDALAAREEPQHQKTSDRTCSCGGRWTLPSDLECHLRGVWTAHGDTGQEPKR